MFGPVTTRMRVPVSLFSGPEPAIIADEAGAVAARQSLLDHGVAAFDDGKDRALIDLRPRIVLLDRKLGEARMVVELGEASARPGKRACSASTRSASLAKMSSSSASARSAAVVMRALELAKLERGEAHDVGERLPMHEHLDMRRLGERAGIGCGDLDEIAEHVVVAHLQRFDAGRLGVARLQPGDHLAAAVAELAMLVEIAIEAVADEAAVALVERQLVGERRARSCSTSSGTEPEPAATASSSCGRPRPAARRKMRGERAGPSDGVAHRAEIARTAAVEREPRQRPRQVGRALAAHRAASARSRGSPAR